MGVFSIYCGRKTAVFTSVLKAYSGAIYNDIFGMNLSLSRSQWGEFEGSPLQVRFSLDSHLSDSCHGQVGVYGFGIDPAWHDAANELPFLNSVKMKLSVVFGITHMTAGIALSACNHVAVTCPGRVAVCRDSVHECSSTTSSVSSMNSCRRSCFWHLLSATWPCSSSSKYCFVLFHEMFSFCCCCYMSPDSCLCRLATAGTM